MSLCGYRVLCRLGFDIIIALLSEMLELIMNAARIYSNKERWRTL